MVLSIESREDLLDVLENMTFDSIIPKEIYLYEFIKDKSIYEGYKSGEYSMKKLILAEKESIINLDFFWPNYIEHFENEDKIVRQYVDESNKIYNVVVSSVGKRKTYANGDLPYALLNSRHSYADVIQELELPECFAI